MSEQSKKLSEELEVYFNNYAKSWLDNNSEVVEAVRELEFQLDAHISAASVEAREADRLRDERDEWKEIADTWAKQHHELGTALDEAEAKLAAVREWRDRECFEDSEWYAQITAILDGAPKPPRVGSSLRSAIRKVKDEP